MSICDTTVWSDPVVLKVANAMPVKALVDTVENAYVPITQSSLSGVNLNNILSLHKRWFHGTFHSLQRTHLLTSFAFFTLRSGLGQYFQLGIDQTPKVSCLGLFFVISSDRVFI